MRPGLGLWAVHRDAVGPAQWDQGIGSGCFSGELGSMSKAMGCKENKG